MANFQNNELQIELLKNLQLTTTLVQNLLGDIKDHSTSLALVKAKLEGLADNVEALSHIIRDDNGKNSVITRLALNEKSIEDVEAEFHELKKEILSMSKRYANREIKNAEDDRAFNRTKFITQLKIFGGIIAGGIALALQIIQIVWK